MGNVVAVPIRTQSLRDDPSAVPVVHLPDHCMVLPFHKPAAKPESR